MVGGSLLYERRRILGVPLWKITVLDTPESNESPYVLSPSNSGSIPWRLLSRKERWFIRASIFWPKLTRRVYSPVQWYLQPKIDKVKMKLKGEDKPPRLQKRERALTIPLKNPGRVGLRKQRTSAQDQSPLLRLPAEIRLLIWKAYIGNQDTYVLCKDGKLRSFHSVGKPEKFIGEDNFSYDDDDFPDEDYLDVDEDISPFRKGIDVLPLLQSCRIVYSELVRVVYQHTAFTFCDMVSFTAFASSIVSERFDQIRSINFSILDNWPIGEIHSFEVTNIAPNRFAKSAWVVDLDFEEQDQNLRRYSYLRLWKPYLRHPIPPSRIDTCSTTWQMACQILESMKGLERLRIECWSARLSHFHDDSMDNMLEFFDPLKPVFDRNMKDVEISLLSGAIRPTWRSYRFTRRYEHTESLLPHYRHETPQDIPRYDVAPKRGKYYDGKLLWSKVPIEELRKWYWIDSQIGPRNDEDNNSSSVDLGA